MVRCLNCGSTAQIKSEREIHSGDRLIKIYTCGCGSKFTIIYKKETTITNVSIPIDRNDRI